MAQRHPHISLAESWRILRVLYWLGRRPADLIPYLQFGLGAKKTPLELGVPWWTFGAVRALEKKVAKNMEAFEFGSGGSTLFLAERCSSVIAVEDDKTWTELVRAKAAMTGRKNVEILHRPFDFSQSEDFEQSQYFKSLGSKHYDIIVVDGQEQNLRVRIPCFRAAESRIRTGGTIVLDDSYRYPELKTDHQALRKEVFRGTGYCRRGVSETTLFYY